MDEIARDEGERAPERYATDEASLARESDMTFFVAGGPGGQHRNKVSSGVRLLHRPSGIVVTATERRSQAANRAVAFERLAARLLARQHVPETRIDTRPSRGEKRRRRADKRQRSTVKQQRRAPRRDE